MDNNKIFKKSDAINSKILKILKKAKNELDVLYNTHQKVSDLRSGVVYKNGLYIPLSSVDHRILIDGYEVQFLKNFIKFSSKMLTGGENIFKEFAIRTIAEMGLKDMQILFGTDLTENEKSRFKTMIVLADIAFLGFNRPSRVTQYKKLLNDQKQFLTKRQLSIFIEMKSSLDSKNHKENKRMVKKLRKLIDSTRNDLYLKTKTPKIIRSENIDAFFSAFSHLIHGNVILLVDLFSSKRPINRNKLRVAWVLLMTGINTTIHIEKFLRQKGVKLDLNDIVKEFEDVSKEVASYWKSIELGSV